uniref:Uncharacterized protein n=1 Tax=Panagrolaimus sp. JU765 TaxID=591449 RepID=A0AC34RCY2_9BILA
MSFLPATFPNVPELPGEIPADKKPDIFTLMKIGYTLDGSFDPDHEDFQFCCCHIHTAMKVVLILMGIVEVFGLYAEAMTYLYTAVISSLSLFAYIFLFYFAYIDYKYVKGRIRSGFV